MDKDPFNRIFKFDIKAKERAVEYLKDHPEGLTNEQILHNFLNLKSTSFGVQNAIVQALFNKDQRVEFSDGIWRYKNIKRDLQSSHFLSCTYLVVDVETTGCVSPWHRITEIGAVKIINGEIKETFQTLVNPGMKIPKFISDLTGITNEMIANAPRSEEVMPKVWEMLKDSIFVAHNVSFDYRFIRNEIYLALNRQLNVETLCTLRLARHLIKGIVRKNLDEVLNYLDISIENRHRGMDDSLATAKILLKFFDMLSEKGITTYQELKLFEKSGILPKIA